MQLLPAIEESIPNDMRRQLESLAASHDQAVGPEVDADWLVDGLARIIGELAVAAKSLPTS